MDIEPKEPNLEAQFRELLDVCEEIRALAVKRLSPKTFFELNTDEQQLQIDRLNDHMAFEFARRPELKGLPLLVSGYGLMLIADGSGEVIGGETISDGDSITGTLDDIWFYPVPTLECVKLGDGESTPIIDVSLSGMLMLQHAQFSTDPLQDGSFGLVHDLDEFSIAVPLSHALRPSLR